MLSMEKRQITPHSSLLPQESSELITSFVHRQVCVALCQVPYASVRKGGFLVQGDEARLRAPRIPGEDLL